jgi:hypothetical protein
MSIEADVTQAMKSAMRARQADRLRAIRNIRAAFLLTRKETGADSIEDADAIKVLRRLAKQRKDSIQSFVDGGREDLAQAERDELAVVDEFLPAGPTEATVRGWVEAAIAATGASSAREIGKVMGSVMKSHRGEADGNVVRRIASELLS